MMLLSLTVYLLACHLAAFGLPHRRRGPAEIVDLEEYRAQRRQRAARADRALARMRTAVGAKRPLAGRA
jgi:hypothetical protein